MPLNTGWLPAGLWVAIALDNLAEAIWPAMRHPAAALMYATLNHGTPLYTWCEETRPGTRRDAMHRRPPAPVDAGGGGPVPPRYAHHGDGEELHLARGTDRDWLQSGQPVGIENACTYFGTVSYEMTFNPADGRVTGKAVFPKSPAGPDGPSPKPQPFISVFQQGKKITGLGPNCKAAILPDATGIRWQDRQASCKLISRTS